MGGGDCLTTVCVDASIVYFLKIMTSLCRKTALMAMMMRMEMMMLHLLVW